MKRQEEETDLPSSQDRVHVKTNRKKGRNDCLTGLDRDNDPQRIPASGTDTALSVNTLPGGGTMQRRRGLRRRAANRDGLAGSRVTQACSIRGACQLRTETAALLQVSDNGIKERNGDEKQDKKDFFSSCFETVKIIGLP